MRTDLAIANKEAARGKPYRVFDWHKAARVIRDSQYDAPVKEASAGLAGDWEYTGGPIYRGGAPVPADWTYTYLASNWATPELDLDGELQDCWVYESDTDGWGPGTYWPQSALDILNAADAH